MKQQDDEARRQFEAAARELVEANKRARAVGKSVTEELLAAAKRLGNAQDQLKETDSNQARKFEPVPLTELLIAKIDQTFAPHDRRELMDFLVNECGRNLPQKAEATSLSLDQIRLAVLKLANGNLDELRRQVKIAKSDWRDVILVAESPEALSFGLVQLDKLDADSRAAITARDRQQYSDCLNSHD